jgi:RecB family exonuclease
VDGRGRWYLKAKSYYSFGTTLHHVLEQFHRGGRAGVPTTEEMMALYEENWIDAGFSSAEEMAEAFGEGRVILERHIDDAKRKPITARTLFVEKQLSLDMGEFVLIGRLDRVDEQEDGSLEIIDYKSGRESVCEDDVRFDLAMSCYQLLLRHKFPDREIKATVIALRSGQEASFSLDASDLDELARDLRTLGARILSDDFHDFVPTLKPMCGNCDFIPLCRKHEEFESG